MPSASRYTPALHNYPSCPYPQAHHLGCRGSAGMSLTETAFRLPAVPQLAPLLSCAGRVRLKEAAAHWSCTAALHARRRRTSPRCADRVIAARPAHAEEQGSHVTRKPRGLR